MNRTLIYEITSEYDGFQIDKFLKTQGYSSANITAIKKMPNNVVINGEWVHMNRKLAAGEVLTVNISEEDSSEKIPPVEMSLDIVYEDEDIIVINKPAGLSIHPSLNHYEDSLANGLAYYYEQQGKPFIFRCANRLDKNTSGLTVIAKHLVSGNILSTMVKNREFHREYYAIVRGTLDEPEGTIDAPIGRDKQDRKKMCVTKENGKEAVTHFKVLKRYKGYTLINLSLETGRTHQIRVHMKYIGYPVYNDPVYTNHKCTSFGQFLHSWKIDFDHPITKEHLHFEVPVPNEFQEFLDTLTSL